MYFNTVCDIHVALVVCCFSFKLMPHKKKICVQAIEDCINKTVNHYMNQGLSSVASTISGISVVNHAKVSDM